MATTALTKEQVCEQVRQILAQQLNVMPNALLPTARIEGDLGADSLDVMEIVLSLEQEFAISIPDEDIRSLATVGDAIEYVQRKLNE